MNLYGKTLMICPLNEQRRIVAYLDGLPPTLRYGDLRQAKVNEMRELQSKRGGAVSVPAGGGVCVNRPEG